jgi:uncharacterized membrane protein
MALRAAASLLIIIAAAPHSLAADGLDAEVLAIARKHCVMCHAASPTHESVREAPKDIILETVANLKKYAATIYAQTVQTKAMPLGNQTGMTDKERMILGRWLKGLP